jgi:hypothetical protein
LLLRSLEGLGRHEEALEHIARLRPSPVFADGFAEVAVRCARRARPEAVERLVAGVASSYRRARMRTGGEDALSRARATLTERPYDHFALMSAIRLLERRDPESPELGELFGRALFVSPEDVPPERRPAALEAFLPTASRR